jgi:hypothetical protein
MTPPPLLLPPLLLLEPPDELDELEELDEPALEELDVDPPELAACAGGDTSGAIDAFASDATRGEVLATTTIEWFFAPCLTWTVFSFEPPRRPMRNAARATATATAATIAI